MATLILTTVGRALFGPIGGAIGAVVGQQIDNRLFAPKEQTGPRLADLSVQGSSYGAPLPILFGRSRVAGTVIWATDFKEEHSSVSTGKGRPRQTTYSYSANFAVALSARKVSRIGRIWADGKLLRGEAGDFKSATGFRFHSGEEDQVADPLITAAEGFGATVAYRGTAYAVFEGFQLADYGNRIPSLSFEVIADESLVSVGAIISTVVSKSYEVQCPTEIEGMAIVADSVRSAVDGISKTIPLLLTDTGTNLVIREQPFPGISIAPNELGTTSDGKLGPVLRRHRLPQLSGPGRRSLAYSDVERDYQQGVQLAQKPGGGARDIRSEFAATLSPSRARQLVGRRLMQDGFDREEIGITLPYRFAALNAGAGLTVPHLAGKWHVDHVRFEGMVSHVTLKQSHESAAALPSAESGRVLAEADLVHGPTKLHLVDLPWLDEGIANAPSVFVAAAGFQRGWKRASLLLSLDDGATFSEAGVTSASAVIGSALSGLAPSMAGTIDYSHSVDVELLHVGMALYPTTEAALLSGANLCMLGGELLQFLSAAQLTPTRYRLSGLLRGRRGTEFANGLHMTNERFILIERATLLPLPIPIATPKLIIQAIGIGDSSPVAENLLSPGLSLIPPTPVHLRYNLLSNGDLFVSWNRRSRDGWRWNDFVDAPLAEESEGYEVRITPNVGVSRTILLPEIGWTYGQAEQNLDASGGATTVTVSVRQIGTFGPSRPCVLNIALN